LAPLRHGEHATLPRARDRDRLGLHVALDRRGARLVTERGRDHVGGHTMRTDGAAAERPRHPLSLRPLPATFGPWFRFSREAVAGTGGLTDNPSQRTALALHR